jgi:predicted nicotinamide N-methyase
MVSLVGAVLGMSVVATDIPECLAHDTAPNVEANAAVLQGSKGTLEARPLVWGETPLEPFGAAWDLVVASDVIYRSEHVPLLLSTLKAVTGPNTTSFVAFDRRGREGIEAFLRAVKAEDSGLSFHEVGSEEMPPGYRFVHFGLVELRAALCG